MLHYKLVYISFLIINLYSYPSHIHLVNHCKVFSNNLRSNIFVECAIFVINSAFYVDTINSKRTRNIAIVLSRVIYSCNKIERDELRDCVKRTLPFRKSQQSHTNQTSVHVSLSNCQPLLLTFEQ